MRLYKWNEEYKRRKGFFRFRRRDIGYVSVWEVWAKEWMKKDKFLVPRIDAFYYTFNPPSSVENDPAVKKKLIIHTPDGKLYLFHYSIDPEEDFKHELECEMSKNGSMDMNDGVLQKEESRAEAMTKEEKEEIVKMMRDKLWECMFLLSLRANEYSGTLEVIFNLFNPFKKALDWGIFTYFMYNYMGLVVYNEVEIHEYLSISFPSDAVYRIDSSEDVALRILGFEGERASEEMVKKWFETCRRMKKTTSKMRGDGYAIVKH